MRGEFPLRNFISQSGIHGGNEMGYGDYARLSFCQQRSVVVCSVAFRLGLLLSAFCLRGCLLDRLDQLIRSTGGANCFQITHTGRELDSPLSDEVRNAGRRNAAL